MRRRDLPPRDGKAIRVAFYARVSTSQQAEKEEGSLDTQFSRLRSHLDSRPGNYEIVGEYREEGVSGGSMDRPAFQKLLARVRRGEVDLIVVTSLDRFSRSLRDFLDLQVEFQELGVELVSLKETFVDQCERGARRRNHQFGDPALTKLTALCRVGPIMQTGSGAGRGVR